MEIINSEDVEETIATPQLVITPEIKEYLRVTSQWGTFLAILGFIGAGILVFIGGLMVIFSIGSSIFMSATDLDGFSSMGASLMMVFMAVIYGGIGVLYFFPANYLFKFCRKIKVAIESNDMIELTLSFENLKKCFKFIGIGIIAMIGFYIILMVGMVVFGMFAALTA